jgi:acetylornithine deacetylase
LSQEGISPIGNVTSGSLYHRRLCGYKARPTSNRNTKTPQFSKTSRVPPPYTIVQSMQDPTIKLLRELVAINSVNPSLAPGEAGEREISHAIAAVMRVAGLDVDITEVAPGRPNVVGVLAGRSPGRSLMFCGHTDTVGVEGMDAPFDPVEQDGRVYGRGSQDMKGGVAAMLGAANQLAASGGLKYGSLIVAAVADEEHASLGAEAVVKRWHADGAVVTEPTDLLVAVGHKGFSWVEVSTKGRAAHGSRPSDGRDAILRMGRVLSRLEALDRELQRCPPHAVQGVGSLHASIIRGGHELSTYPDNCVLQIERRTTSLEPRQTAINEVDKILATLKSEDEEFECSARLMFDRLPFETPPQDKLPQLLEEALGRIGHTPVKRGGVSFSTDAAVLASAGIPTVVFGPGGEGLHSLKEYVRAKEVLACRDALVELARSFCTSGS